MHERKEKAADGDKKSFYQNIGQKAEDGSNHQESHRPVKLGKKVHSQVSGAVLCWVVHPGAYLVIWGPRQIHSLGPFTSSYCTDKGLDLARLAVEPTTYQSGSDKLPLGLQDSKCLS